VYSVAYNIFRIMSGIGGLAFAIWLINYNVQRISHDCVKLDCFMTTIKDYDVEFVLWQQQKLRRRLFYDNNNRI
jgi:hypothetical protein